MNILEELSSLVSIDSTYPNEHQISKHYTKLLKSLGFSVTLQEVIDGRSNILATRGESPKIMFYGHQDTVTPVNPSQWSHDPYTPITKGYRLYGLGSYDMKGGIVAFLHALSQSEAPAKIFLAVDEEYYSQGAWHAIKHSRSFFKNIELIISSEPNFGLGLNGITTARTGRVIFEATAEGKAEHISKYKSAQDAIEKLTSFTQKLYKQRESLFNDPYTVAQIRMLEAESVGMSVCALATAQVEVLPGAKDSIPGIRKKLQDLGQVTIKLKDRPTPFLSGYSFESFPYQDKIGSIVAKATGQPMSLHHRSSVGDDNALATLGIPVITWGPNGDNAHKENEWVSIPSIKKLSTMYQQLLNQK